MAKLSATSVKISLLRRPWVGPAVAAAAILVAGWLGLVQPQVGRWSDVASQRQAAAASVSQLQSAAGQLAKVEEEYQSIRRDSVRSVSRLDTLVPQKVENSKVFSEFQHLVEQLGLVLVSVRISPDPKPGDLHATTLSLSVSGGNYAALKRLLQVMERNLRLTDVVNLTFDAQVQAYTIAANIYSFE